MQLSQCGKDDYVSTGERPSHVGPETETNGKPAVQNEVCFHFKEARS